jgi:hypothetical protein
MKNVYSTCDKCGKDIQYGEPHVSFCKYTEYVEYVNERNRTEAEVIEAVDFIMLCESCGKAVDTKLISKMVNVILQHERSTDENDNKQIKNE